MKSTPDSGVSPSHSASTDPLQHDQAILLASDDGADDVPINLVLRIRNAKRELNDIRFEFTVDKGLTLPNVDGFMIRRVTLFLLLDTADGIAGELISAGLVDAKDCQPVAQNLQRLIADRAKMKSVVFQLVSFTLCILIYVSCMFFADFCRQERIIRRENAEWLCTDFNFLNERQVNLFQY